MATSLPGILAALALILTSGSAGAAPSCGTGGAAGESQITVGPSWVKIRTPPGYTPDKAYPLWLVLHGDEGSPSTVYPRFATLQDRGGEFLLATPKAYLDGGSWWHTPNPQMQFLDQVLARLIADFNVDEDRIYLAGFSGGGSIATHYAVERQDSFTGVLFLAGGSLGPGYDPPPGSCPISAYYVMGEWDSLKTLSRTHHDLLQSKGHQTQWVSLPATGHEWQKVLADGVLDAAWTWLKSKTLCGSSKAGHCGELPPDSGVPDKTADGGSGAKTAPTGDGAAASLDGGPGAPVTPATSTPGSGTMTGGCAVAAGTTITAGAPLLLALLPLVLRRRHR